jgi:hypothetical protein
MPMNIYSPRGAAVIFRHPDAGYQPNIEEAAKYLKIGHEYHVAYTDVSSSITYVGLVEVPGKSFNSVMFEESVP